MKKLFLLILLLSMCGSLAAQNPAIGTYTYESNRISGLAAAGSNIQVGQLVKPDPNGRLIPTTTSDTGGVIAVAATGTTQSGASFSVVVLGSALVLVDGVCSIGNPVYISSTLAGAGTCTASSRQQIGIAANSSPGSGSFIQVYLSTTTSGLPGGTITGPIVISAPNINSYLNIAEVVASPAGIGGYDTLYGKTSDHTLRARFNNGSEDVFATLNANNNYTGQSTFSGPQILGSISNPTIISADQNNYNLTGINVARLTSDASRNITGLLAPSGSNIFTIFNVGSFNIVLKNQNASSTAANRLALGADVTLAPDNGITLLYDIASSRWRAMGRSN